MEESDKDDFDVLNQLAKGGQGITTRVRRKRDNTIWVMKESYVDSTKAGNSALREAKTLQSLNHPYINRYQDVFLHQDGGDLVVCTVMEYCEGGDLAHYLIAFKRHNMIIEPDRALRWMQQMCSALAYLHSHKVVHRDLKPQNIFMMTEDSLRVGDFGLAQTIERGKRTSQVGTPCYMAPEVLHHDAYAESVDIWGLGCIGLEAITLNFLWERKGMLAAQVLTDPIHASSMSPEYPACLRESIAKCLVHGANKRPSAAMLEGALFSAMERAGDQSGLVEVIGNLAQQWTSWLSPQGNNQALGRIREEEEPEQAVLSQMPDTVPHRPEGRPIPLSEQRRIAANNNNNTSPQHSPHQHEQQPASRPSPPQEAAPSSSLRKTPAQLEAEVQRMLATAQNSARLVSGGRKSSSMSSSSSSSKTRGGGVGGPAIDGEALARLGPPPSFLPHHSPQGFILEEVMQAAAAGRAAAAARHQQQHEPDDDVGQASSSSEGTEMDEAPDASLRRVGRARTGGGGRGEVAGGVPDKVMDEYARNGLFGIDPKWRAAVQARLQADKAQQVSSVMDATASRLAGGGSKDFGSTLLMEGEGETTRASPPAPKDKSSSISGLFNSLRGKYKKESKQGASRGDNKVGDLALLGDKKILVERASKQYELVYPRQQWLQAREATARNDGQGYVYGTEGDIQKAFERLFGQPASRFIGTSDNLMAC